jgi:hypothetical protein
MTANAHSRYQYCVAAAVGICFGLLLGGAAAFVIHVERPAPTVEWSKVSASERR